MYDCSELEDPKFSKTAQGKSFLALYVTKLAEVHM